MLKIYIRNLKKKSINFLDINININENGNITTRVCRDEAESNIKVASGSRVAGTIRSLVSARSLQLEYDWVLSESLLVPVLTYNSDNDMEGEGEV